MRIPLDLIYTQKGFLTPNFAVFALKVTKSTFFEKIGCFRKFSLKLEFLAHLGLIFIKNCSFNLIII